MIGICIVILIFFVNIVWQIYMFVAFADDEMKDEDKLQKEKITASNQKKLLLRTTEPIYKKEKVKMRNKFEVNNWRKMHGLVKKSKKTWKRKGV